MPAFQIFFRAERFEGYDWKQFREALVRETAREFSTIERSLNFNAFGIINFHPVLPPGYLSKDVIAWFSHTSYPELLQEGNERARVVAEAMSDLLKIQLGVGHTVGVAVFLGETRWGSDLARHLEP